MEAATQNQLPIKSKNKGKKDDVIKLKPLRDNLADLLVLAEKLTDARDTFSEKVKAVAKQSGLQPGVVKKLVNAKATDRFDKAARQVEQLAIVFGEIDNL